MNHRNQSIARVTASSSATPGSPTLARSAPLRGTSSHLHDDDESQVVRLIRQTISQWWKVIAYSSLIVAGLSTLLILWSFQPSYRATALIQIEEHAPVVVDQVNPSSSRYVPTQIEIIRSKIVLESLVQDAQLRSLDELTDFDDPFESLVRRINVRPVGGSELYEVSCDAYSAETAMQLTNRVVDSYFSYRAQSETERTKRVIQLLDEESSRREAKLSKLRERFRELGEKAAAAGTVSDSTMSSSLASTIGPIGTVASSLQDRITMAEVEQQVLSAKLRALDEQSVARPWIEADVQVAIDTDPRVIREQSALMEQEQQLEKLSRAVAGGKSSVAYTQRAKDVEIQRELVERLRSTVRDGAVKRMEATEMAKQSSKRRDLQDALASYKMMEKTLRERRNEQLRSRSETSTVLVELEFARAELEQEENAQKMLAHRATALRTELGAPQQVNLLRHAEVPTKPITEMPWKRLCAGLLASMVLPFGCAVGLEFLGQRVRSRDQLEHSLEMCPGVIEVARLPRTADPQRAILLSDDRDQLYMESIDRLSASLMLSPGQPAPQVLAVMSAVSGEGKTRTAVQMSISLSRLQKSPVLLIDADLRRPDMHAIWEIDMRPGLGDIIDYECPVESAIYKVTEGVHVMPAGDFKRHPRDLLGDPRFQDILDHVRGRYSRVVVDTPPLLPASEALFVAQSVDGVVLCTRCDHSRESSVTRAYQDLAATGIRPVGIVLNGISKKQYSSQYGSYRYQYYPVRERVS